MVNQQGIVYAFYLCDILSFLIYLQIDNDSMVYLYNSKHDNELQKHWYNSVGDQSVEVQR